MKEQLYIIAVRETGTGRELYFECFARPTSQGKTIAYFSEDKERATTLPKSRQDFMDVYKMLTADAFIYKVRDLTQPYKIDEVALDNQQAYFIEYP